MPTQAPLDFATSFRDRTVLVTGHTGFKGSWLTQWLVDLGANVVGYALEPPTDPALYDALSLSDVVADDVRADVRDRERIREVVGDHRPEFVFHLAAQPLVRYSFDEPLETFETNAIGTLNLLDALTRAELPCTCVAVTTDKVYKNNEWVHAYREPDPLGGYDPYSASKACAELITSSWRRSFCAGTGNGKTPAIASARGGNVIGGGDWALDRIVPDCVRAIDAGETIPVRNKTATRPWQHVLDLLGGYLTLAVAIDVGLRDGDTESLADLCSAWNFGPPLDSNRTVENLVTEILSHWPGEWEDKSDPHAKHEAGRLNLAIDKAHHGLGWSPTWGFPEAIAETVAWYRAWYEGEREAELVSRTRAQIAAYSQAMGVGEDGGTES